MSVEAKRGCGYRKVGGLYLVGSGLGARCDRLPWPVGVCRVCGEGIRPARGVRWLNGADFFGGNCKALEQEKANPAIPIASDCHPMGCPVCHSDELGRIGLMWVGEKFYPTPELFEQEADRLGVSKRIAALPKEIEVGKTWILLIHPRAVRRKIRDKKVEGIGRVETTEFSPGIFHAFKVMRIEQVVTDQESEEALEGLRKRGITPVIVPADDPDHNPTSRQSRVNAPELAVT